MRKLVLLLVLLLGAGSLSAQAGQVTPIDASPCGGPPDPALAAQEPLQAKLFGVVEDSGNSPDCDVALSKARLVTASGFNAVRILIPWGPGLIKPRPEELERYRTAVEAYQSQGLIVIVDIAPDWNRQPNLHMPLQPHDRVQFATYVAAYAHLLPTVRFWEIGLEPNSGTFWYPQCTPDGQGDSPFAYNRLLALSYDALHDAETERPGGLSLVVIGGKLSSHGDDSPGTACRSRSPRNFIGEWGDAYKRSGRQRPVMDIFGYDPYGVTNPEAPSEVHTGGTYGLNDYGRLRQALCQSFSGTGQSCQIPVLYSEYGVQTVTPADKLYLYSGKETVETVSYATQVKFVQAALQMASCQKGVMGVMFFLLLDEPDLGGWQSALYFAEDVSEPSTPPVPKPSQPAITEALLNATSGFTSCSSR